MGGGRPMDGPPFRVCAGAVNADPFEPGAQLFDEGKFFAAHQAWEAARRDAQGDVRRALHGLVLAAAAFLQLEKGRPFGAGQRFQRAEEDLVDPPPSSIRLARFARALPLWRAWADFLCGPGAESGLDAPKRPLLCRPSPVEKDDEALRCPVCAERVWPNVETHGPAQETFIEDCPVCCRPWTVRVQRADGRVTVSLDFEE